MPSVRMLLGWFEGSPHVFSITEGLRHSVLGFYMYLLTWKPFWGACVRPPRRVFCQWYGECMMTPFVQGINKHLPGQLQGFFLKCIAIIKAGGS